MAIKDLAESAKKAQIVLSSINGELKNKALETIVQSLSANRYSIFQANKIDIKSAEALGIALPILKRLKFDESKLEEVCAGIRSLISLEEPVGKTLMITELDEGLTLQKVTCPIGVIGVIFESRPDALVQISTLCLKSGNAVLLKGGAEAIETNRVLAKIINDATVSCSIPQGWLTLMETRSEVTEMLLCDDTIDLLIPRGSNEFVKYIMNNTKIPVMGHADGICHCYVDKDADIDMAVRIVVDSKTQYVAVCNATETVLVHQEVAEVFLPKIEEALRLKEVKMFGDEGTLKIIAIEAVSDSSYDTEYLDYQISIKVVNDLSEAINHINTHGSGHTDTIITENATSAEAFMVLVDSGNVFQNCSTRFSDGFRYGFGAEVGISTSKIHARGPVGLDGLLIYKYKLFGHGQIVADYSEGRKKFTHKKVYPSNPV